MCQTINIIKLLGHVIMSCQNFWVNNLFLCKQDETRIGFSQFTVNNKKVAYTDNGDECYHFV